MGLSGPERVQYYLGVAQQLAQGGMLVAQIPQLQRGALVILAGYHHLRGHQGVPGNCTRPPHAPVASGIVKTEADPSSCIWQLISPRGLAMHSHMPSTSARSDGESN